MAASAISFDLITRVREFYTMAYQEISSNKQKQVRPDKGITDYVIPYKGITDYAISSYIYLVAKGDEIYLVRDKLP